MLKRTVTTRMTLGAAIALALLGADYVSAQEATLEEVVVTARKREENLQDVITAVSALSTADLAKRFDTDLQGFANAAPNLVIDDVMQGPGGVAAISIRGVGSTDVEKSFDPTVGVVVDGIFLGQASGQLMKTVDVQGVEILRGPQGTLFGRNSIAGVINVTRAKPADELSGRVRASYGNYNDIQVDGYVSVPVTEGVSLKLTAAKYTRDGYFYDVTTAHQVGAQDFKSLSPSLRWKVSDTLELNYRLDRTWQRQDPDTQLNMAQANQVWCFYYNQCAPSTTSPQSGGRYTVLNNGEPLMYSYFDTAMHVFSAKWNPSPGYQVDYLFGYYKTEEKAYQDWDGTPLSLYHTDRPANYYQHSHELRLTSTGEGPLSYTVGLYAWNSGYRIDLLSYIGFIDFLTGGAVPPGTIATVPQSVQQKADSTAAFFEGDWKFSPDWTLTVGGRYTRDKKSTGLIDPSMSYVDPATDTTVVLSAANASTAIGGMGNPVEKTWKQFSPKVALKYKITPDITTYALFSQGFRAGGFSGRPGTYDAATTAYNPEKVNNTELGFKSEWLNHRLRLNAAIFYMKYKDKQEEQSYNCTCGTGQETLIVNASSATIKGLELDFAAQIAAGFNVTASFGLLQAKYDSLRDPTAAPNDPAGDLSSLHIRRSPPVTATLSPDYEWAWGPGMASVHVDWHYIGAEELTFFNSPQTSNPHQNIVDPSINYTYKKTRISAYALNLTQDSAWTQGFDVGASRSFAGLWSYTTTRAPRTYGVRVTHDF